MKIVRKEVSTIYPATPCQPCVLFMSGADHIPRPRHVPLLLFYAMRPDGEEVLPTKLMKESLEKVLVLFYPAAGRLRRREDKKLELVCNNAGVEFVEVTVDGTLADFDDFKPNRLYTELLDPVPAVAGDAIFKYPVTYIQVTRFACGGASLLTSINHACTDGLSVSQFLTSWSEVAQQKELSNPPFHDRALLKVQLPVLSDFQPPELTSITGPELAAPKQDVSSWPTERMFIFSPAELKRIKSKAFGEGESGTFSTFESINAHVWHSVTKARGLHPLEDTKFITTLDARKRMKPNLPEGYFGNAICFVRAVATAGDVVQNPLSFVARKIREAISGFSDEYMRSVLAFAQAHKNTLVMNCNWGDSAGHDVSTASWARMGFMLLDFGSGKPIFCSPGNNPFDGSVLMLPSHKGEGYLNVFVALKPEHMDRLQSDPEFFHDK